MLDCVQFNAFVGLVKDMMAQVESEHRTKLEQLNSLQQENRSVRKAHRGKIINRISLAIINRIIIVSLDRLIFVGII